MVDVVPVAVAVPVLDDDDALVARSVALLLLVVLAEVVVVVVPPAAFLSEHETKPLFDDAPLWVMAPT